MIVTGASSGSELRRRARWARPVLRSLLVGRDEARLSEHAETTQKAGGRAEIARVDLEDLEATATLPELAVKAFGSLHGIVQTASLFDPRPLADTSIESMELQWRTNVAAPLVITKAAVPHLTEGARSCSSARRPAPWVSRAARPTRPPRAP